MKSFEELLHDLKKISDLAFTHGISSTFLKYPHFSPVNCNEDEMRYFINESNNGYKVAQELIINEILYYEEVISELQIKSKSQSTNKEEKPKINKLIEVCNMRKKMFKHIADGIAWSLTGGQISSTRRFYQGVKGEKLLKDSNIESSIRNADYINSNPNDFALILDITNYMQIGDLLAKRGENIEIIELKEGKKNKEIKTFIDEHGQKENLEQLINESFNGHTLKQVKRVLNQIAKRENLVNVLNTDKGLDNLSNNKINILSSPIPTVRYSEIFTEMFFELNEKKLSERTIENCLHLTMFKFNSDEFDQLSFEEKIKQITPNNILIDFNSIIDNISEPLFAKPFPPELSIGILSGLYKVIIWLDLDKLIDNFKLNGVDAGYLSKKETAKHLQEKTYSGIFIINNKAIYYSKSESEVGLVGGGIISKILYDNILPSNICSSILNNK